MTDPESVSEKVNAANKSLPQTGHVKSGDIRDLVGTLRREGGAAKTCVVNGRMPT